MADPARIEHGYSCQEVVGLATDYLEGALSAEEMTRFELHLNLCDGCFGFLEQVRTTAAMAGVLSEEQMPDEMKTSLLAAFQEWKRE